MKKKTKEQNKYEKLANEIIRDCKKERRKYKLIGFSIAMIGIIVLICGFAFNKYALYCYIGGLAIVAVGTNIFNRKINNINRYMREQIKLIEAEETKEYLNKVEEKNTLNKQ